jgi:hypothetical protein
VKSHVRESIECPAGLDAVARTTLFDRIGGVKQVHGRVLVASPIAGRDRGILSVPHGLEVMRLPPGDDMDIVTACSDLRDLPV